MREYYGSQMPLLLRLLGARSIQEAGRMWRMKWGEISFGSWGLALNYRADSACGDHRAHIHVRLPGLNAFLYCPWKHRRHGKDAFDEPQWGFSYHDKALWIHYGTKYKALHMPWAWEHVRHDILMADGRWKTVARDTLENPDGGSPWNWKTKFQEKHPYKYTLKNGTVQEVTATIGKEEREWRWRWFTWLPYPRFICTTIDIRFDDEVGERRGSWKGGCLGCGYDILPGEKPVDALRRMEKERVFD